MKRMLAAILVMLTATGCASITRGSHELFVIETTPPNARATLSTGLTCTTPCSLKIPRRGDFVVTLERNGYETVRATVASSVDGEGAAGMAGNVIFGGIIGAGIDAGTGAMHSHQPNPLQVTLVPLATTAADAVAIDSVDAVLEKNPEQPDDADAETAAEDLADGEAPE